MCEKTIQEQLAGSIEDLERFRSLVDVDVYLKDKKDQRPVKIYPLLGQERTIENLRAALDQWNKLKV